MSALAADETIIALFGEGSPVSEQLRDVVEKLGKQCAEGRDFARRAAAGLKVQYQANQYRRNLMGGRAEDKKPKANRSEHSEVQSAVITPETQNRRLDMSDDEGNSVRSHGLSDAL